jgi:hypothetical protein
MGSACLPYNRLIIKVMQPCPLLTAIDHKHQFPDLRQPVEQLLHKGQVKGFAVDPFILDPAAVALHPAVGLGLIGYFSGDDLQLAALAQHNPTDQRSTCGL